MFKALACWICLCAILSAQTIGSAGYLAPAPVSVAPGQILTFFVDGIGATGITATLHQASDVPAPIVDVRSISTCPHSTGTPPPTSCGTLTAVTVQIPYELIPLCPLCASPVLLSPQLIVSGGGHSAAIELDPLADQVHVLTSCDVIMTAHGAISPNNTTGLPCSPMVTHADGSLVNPASPANIGEELTAWTVGLGATNPPAVTGQPPAKPLPTAETLGINYNYTVNALATKPRPAFVPAPTLAPVYSGLAPGFLGLYQINFIVPPQPPNGIATCALPGTFLAGTNAVQSNLTVSFGGAFSFDGAGICVATRIPLD